MEENIHSQRAPSDNKDYQGQKRILMIDDIMTIGDTYNGLPVEYARTLEEGISKIKNHWREYVQIIFDHDLGQYPDGQEMKSVDAAKLLEEMGFEDPEVRNIEITIITDNGPGRKNIGVALRHFPINFTLPRRVRADGR